MTTEPVEDEVIVEGKPGTAALQDFLDDVTVHDSSPEAETVAELEGIAVADASVVLLADEHDTHLLANDKALMTVAQSHGIDCWWVTTLLLRCTKDGVIDTDEAQDVLYELVDAGMNLSPQVYVRVQSNLEKLGE